MQNPEEHWDFTLPIEHGNQYLELAEFAPLFRLMFRTKM